MECDTMNNTAPKYGWMEQVKFHGSASHALETANEDHKITIFEITYGHFTRTCV